MYIATWHRDSILILFHFVKEFVDNLDPENGPLQKIYHFTDYFYLHFTTIHSMQILTVTRNLK